MQSARRKRNTTFENQIAHFLVISLFSFLSWEREIASLSLPNEKFAGAFTPQRLLQSVNVVVDCMTVGSSLFLHSINAILIFSTSKKFLSHHRKYKTSTFENSSLLLAIFFALHPISQHNPKISVEPAVQLACTLLGVQVLLSASHDSQHHGHPSFIALKLIVSALALSGSLCAALILVFLVFFNHVSFGPKFKSWSIIALLSSTVMFICNQDMKHGAISTDDLATLFFGAIHMNFHFLRSFLGMPER